MWGGFMLVCAQRLAVINYYKQRVRSVTKGPKQARYVLLGLSLFKRKYVILFAALASSSITTGEIYGRSEQKETK